MNTDQRDSLLRHASEVLDAGDIPQAINIYSRVLEIEPDNYDACLMLGSLFGETGRIPEAIPLLKQAEQNSSNNAASQVLGHIFRATGESEKALASFQEAVERDPKDTEALCNYGNMLQECGSSDEAGRQFKRAVEVDPKCVGGWLGLGLMYFHVGNFHDSVASLREAMRQKPLDKDILNYFITALLLLDQLDAQEEALKEAIDHHQTHAGLYDLLADVLLKKGQHQNALEYINKALVLEPDDANFLIRKAEILEGWGNPDDAFDLIRPLLESDDVSVNAVLVFTKLSIPLGMKEESRYLLEKAAAGELSEKQRESVNKAISWLDAQ